MLIIEISLVIMLLSFLIYFKRMQVKTLINKITASKLFLKIFWGLILGVGILCFGWLGEELFGGLKILTRIKLLDTAIYIRGFHFVGPILGIFAGITIGASSRPFSVKKMLYCIFTGFIGGLAYTIYMILSEKPRHTPSIDIFTLMIFVFTLMPIAIGIADKSLFKAIIGLIGGGVGIFLCLIFIAIGMGLGGGSLPWGYPVDVLYDPFSIGFYWARIILAVSALTGVIFILLGIDFGEFADLKEFEKLKDIFKGWQR